MYILEHYKNKVLIEIYKFWKLDYEYYNSINKKESCKKVY